MAENRTYLLREATYGQLRRNRPRVAVLPWGATEAHNLHLPHGTDILEAEAFAARAAELATLQGAFPIVLPAIPFGNNSQQLDQAVTINLSTATQAAILADVADSLLAQHIDRLVILNSHGGNEFRPLVRDLMRSRHILCVVLNFYQMLPELRDELFDVPGDHADESETSLLLHLCPDLVDMESAGPGTRLPFDIPELEVPGVWTPRPWSAVHPDTGSGNPAKATAEKGERYFTAICEHIANTLTALDRAEHGTVPYL